MLIKGNVKVELEGRGTLALRPTNYIATGGEGSTYRATQTVIKLYKDIDKMVKDGMVNKLRLLAQFNNPYIVSPKGIVTISGNPVGYYMDFVEGQPLSRIFTTSFCKREKFTNDHALILVDRMIETVNTAHNHKARAILVDANEFNWFTILNRVKGPEPRAIDVDAWAIGKWPAKVIMPSIRDWNSNVFDENSDWFSWGIVTFQIFTGIHPYKGNLAGYKQKDFVKRMKDNASVFSKGVRLNSAVRDFNCIPGKLLDWYMNTFQNGMRCAPPSPFDVGTATTQVARVKYAVTTASGMLCFDKLYEKVNDPVSRVFSCGVVLLDSNKLVDLSFQREIGFAHSRDCEVISVSDGWLICDIDKRKVIFSYVNKSSLKTKSLDLVINGHKIVCYENRLFVVTERGLTEVSLKVLGQPILSVGQTWGAMINSTQWFDGVGIQDAMGATFVIAPFGEKSCSQIRVQELDGLKPVIAKAGNRFIVVIGLDKSGIYHKVELTMDRNYETYKVWQTEVDSPDLNMTILPKGACATIIDDGELDIFVPTSGKLNKVSDKYVSADMMLANWGDKVVYIQKGAVWKVGMK